MRKNWRGLLVLFILMAMSAWSVQTGPAGPLAWHDDGPLMHLRVARTLLALAEGAGLALSGLLLQSLFRNPLVDAGLLGVAPATCLGGLLMLLLGAPIAWLPLAGGGAALLVLFLLLLSWRRRSSLAAVLLMGLALNAVLGAGLQLLLSALPADRLAGAWGWLQGSFAEAHGAAALVLLVLVLLAYALVWRQHRALDWLLLGTQVARSAGIDSAAVQRQLIVLAAVLTAALVSQAGVVGFIGMMAPALVRWSLPGGHARWLPWSVSVGAVVALFADILARLLVAPAEVPVGVISSLLGAPVFLWLLVGQPAVQR